MGFNSAFKGLKLLKTPGNGRLNNLNDPVLNVLSSPGPLPSSYLVLFFTAVHTETPCISSSVLHSQNTGI